MFSRATNDNQDNPCRQLAADAGGGGFHIRAGEGDAPGGEAVEVGRVDVSAAVGGEVAIAEVVGENDDKIR